MEALAELGADAASEAVVTAATDPRLAGTPELSRALARVGTEPALAPLRRWLQAARIAPSEELVSALAEAGTQQSVLMLLDLVRGWPSGNALQPLQERAARELGQLASAGNEPALAALAAARQAPSASIRAAAARALARWQVDAKGSAELLEMCLDEEPAVRELALDALEGERPLALNQAQLEKLETAARAALSASEPELRAAAAALIGGLAGLRPGAPPPFELPNQKPTPAPRWPAQDPASTPHQTRGFGTTSRQLLGQLEPLP